MKESQYGSLYTSGKNKHHSTIDIAGKISAQYISILLVILGIVLASRLVKQFIDPILVFVLGIFAIWIFRRVMILELIIDENDDSIHKMMAYLIIGLAFIGTVVII